MKKYETIKKHEEFSEIINKSKYIKNDYFVIYYRDSNINFPKFGIAISNKFGKANIRNYYKRITRSFIDKNKNLFKNYQEYIIMIKKKSLNIDFHILEKSFENLAKEIFNEEKN